MSNSRNNRGQQLIEYLLLFAVVIIVVVLFVSPTGPFRRHVNQTLNLSLEELDRAANRL